MRSLIGSSTACSATLSLRFAASNFPLPPVVAVANPNRPEFVSLSSVTHDVTLAASTQAVPLSATVAPGHLYPLIGLRVEFLAAGLRLGVDSMIGCANRNTSIEIPVVARYTMA